MRLTNTIRDAFVRSVMNDVPFVDYNEAASKLVINAIASYFKETFGVEIAELGQGNWVNLQSVQLPGHLLSVYTYSSHYNFVERNLPELWETLKALDVRHREQNIQRAKLEEQIRGVTMSVTTRKALADALPEFEKYLPQDEAKAVRTLPVVQNVIADFVKAGWPKTKEGAPA